MYTDAGVAVPVFYIAGIIFGAALGSDAAYFLGCAIAGLSLWQLGDRMESEWPEDTFFFIHMRYWGMGGFLLSTPMTVYMLLHP